jgi:hypothetical protein
MFYSFIIFLLKAEKFVDIIQKFRSADGKRFVSLASFSKNGRIIV